MDRLLPQCHVFGQQSRDLEFECADLNRLRRVDAGQLAVLSDKTTFYCENNHFWSVLGKNTSFWDLT